jgi:CheY-like chemotaxis protein
LANLSWFSGINPYSQWTIGRKVPAMDHSSKHRVLVVDDESSIRDMMAMLLEEAGYEVSTAENGLGALAQIKRLAPDVIISDLNMPQMSGFELLSVVRRRFPEIPVVAMSGAHDAADDVPGGVIADAFYSKGRFQLEQLLRTLADLLQTSEARAIDHRRKLAPVWIPLNGMDSMGIPFVMLTCTECLRSFSVSVLRKEVQELQETPCIFCSNPVRYIIDFSIAIAPPQTRLPENAGGQASAAIA